jgi:SAM-dependent methyltransferase
MNEDKLTGLSNQEFISAWGEGGYTEDFSGYQPQHKGQIVSELSKYYNQDHTCLEIGCGAGLWTKENLCPNFKTVTALDILPEEKINLLHNPPPNVNYIQLNDRDYECTGVEDNSIDFVFSFGVFCHLTNSAANTYINSIHNKLKPGGQGLIMFADFHRNFKYGGREFCDEVFGCIKDILADTATQDLCREEKTFGGWHWNDMETIGKIFNHSGFNSYADVSPDEFRDCLMHFKKTKN